MYVAVRDVTLRQAGYRTVAEGLSELGLNAVELAVNRDLSVAWPDTVPTSPRRPVVTPSDVAACRQAYADAGIHVSGLLMANNFNAANIDDEIEWVLAGVAVAEGLGADAVRIDAAMTGQHELALDRRASIYSQAVCRVLRDTPDSDVPVGIENHGLQGTDPRWLQCVLDTVGSPRLGLTLDTANFYWAGHPIDQVYAHIEHFAPYTKHVHCKNISFEPDKRDKYREPGWGYGDHVCPIPDGDIDHHRVVELLTVAGYCGGLAIEDEALGKFEGDERRRQLLRGADHLAGIAEQFGGSRLHA